MRVLFAVCVATACLASCTSNAPLTQPSAAAGDAAIDVGPDGPDEPAPPVPEPVVEDASAPESAAPSGPEPVWGQTEHPGECAACHPDHVAQWEMSPHAYAAVDPVFHAMVRLGQQETDGELGQFCTRCHSPFAVKTNQTPVLQGEDGPYQPLDSLGPIARAGVSCDVCHTADTVGGEDLLGFGTGDTRRGGIADPVPNAEHASEASLVQQSSNMCGACHDVEFDGLLLEQTFTEWLSVGSLGTCQDCHMPARRGLAALDGPEREVHDHTFVGVDVSLLPPADFPGYDRLRELSRQLLQEQSVRVRMGAESGRVTVSITNLAGHALPSGATADRQLWIELRVLDASGAVRFESGTVDARGDLRDDEPAHTLQPGTDPQLTVFRQRLLNDAAEVHFPWQASSLEQRLIRPGGSVEVGYAIGDLPPGQYRAEMRLRIRAFPPYLLRLLEREAGLPSDVAPRMPVVDMAMLEETFSVR